MYVKRVVNGTTFVEKLNYAYRPNVTFYTYILNLESILERANRNSNFATMQTIPLPRGGREAVLERHMTLLKVILLILWCISKLCSSDHLFCVQDLNNIIFLNAIKGMVIYLKSFHIHVCFCNKLEALNVLHYNMLQPSHHWKFGWAELCKTKLYTKLKITNSPVSHLLETWRRCLILLQGAFPCLDGMNLMNSLINLSNNRIFPFLF